jgi:hypothetical protein
LLCDWTDEFILFVLTASHLFTVSLKYIRSDCFIVCDVPQSDKIFKFLEGPVYITHEIKKRFYCLLSVHGYRAHFLSLLRHSENIPLMHKMMIRRYRTQFWLYL